MTSNSPIPLILSTSYDTRSKDLYILFSITNYAAVLIFKI
nr:MAG TPA: hypothetical protein [Caudoviricetes sp.]